MSRPYESGETLYARYRRKADQEWELAGCARQDGDTEDEKRHTELAREYSRLAAEVGKQ